MTALRRRPPARSAIANGSPAARLREEESVFPDQAAKGVGLSRGALRLPTISYAHDTRKHAVQATILVVDDTPSNIAVLTEILRGDYRVLAALNGEQALKVARGDPPPELILLDVMMPGMSGLDAARVLRQSPDTAGIPVIMLTARAQETDIEQGFAAGADDYVTKPFSPRELASRVAAVLARSGA